MGSKGVASRDLPSFSFRYLDWAPCGTISSSCYVDLLSSCRFSFIPPFFLCLFVPATFLVGLDSLDSFASLLADFVTCVYLGVLDIIINLDTVSFKAAPLSLSSSTESNSRPNVEKQHQSAVPLPLSSVQLERDCVRGFGCKDLVTEGKEGGKESV